MDICIMFCLVFKRVLSLHRENVLNLECSIRLKVNKIVLK